MITLSLNILDIIQNSIRAGAGIIELDISESVKDDIMIISVTDNGKGIAPEILENVTDPFVTTRKTRKIGMGLSLLRQHAVMAGGDIKVDSRERKGTKVEAMMKYSHIDRQPLGDISGVMIILIASNPEIDFIYNHKTDKGTFHFSVEETKEYLGISSFKGNELMNDLREYITVNLEEIGVSG